MGEDLAILKDELATVGKKKEELFSQKQVISSQIVSAINKIKEHKVKRDELTGQVKTLKVKRDEFNGQLKVLFAELKVLSADLPKPTFKSTDKPQVSSSQIKRIIEQKQMRIETEAMSFENEQKVMKEIKDLKKQLVGAQNVVTERAELREVSKKIDALKNESDQLHAQIQQMAADSQKEHEAILSLSKQIDDLRIKEKDTASQASELKAAYKESASKVSAIQMAVQAERFQEKREQEKQVKIDVEKKAKDVERKIKEKKTLSTEDLLVFQSQSDD